MRSLSLKTKAALTFTALLLAVLGLVCAVLLSLVKAEMLQVLQANQLMLAARTADEIDDKLQISMNALTRLAETLHPETPADWAALQEVIEHRPGVNSLFDNTTVIAADGHLVARFPDNERIGTFGVADRPWFRNVMASGLPTVSEPVRSRVHGQPVVILVVPLRDRQGVMIGAISGALNLFRPNFLGHIATTKIGATGSVSLLSLNRTIIIARDHSSVMTAGPAPGISAYFDRAMTGVEGVEENAGGDGVRALYAYQSLKLAPWVLTAGLPINEAMAPIARTQARIVLLMLAAALLSIPFIWFAVRGLLVPLGRLHQTIREIRDNPAAPTEVKVRTSDEIGALAEDFNHLTRERLRSDEQVRAHARELERANEELKAFSYSVSHDLRGPLRSMDGFAMVLMEDYHDKLDDEGRDALERIRAASQTMGTLIDDMLRLSQVSRVELNLTCVDLSAMAGEIAETISLAHPRRAVQWLIEPRLELRADAALLRIAMQNLLQNAWKFTARAPHAVIRVGKKDQPSGPVFFVADNGVGFDMAHADKLFGAFQRLHYAGDFPGTGIGLAIVQRIVYRHGGEIRAEAVQDQGATFYFRVKETEHGTDEQDHPAD